MTNTVQFKNVSKQYKNFLLDGISFNIPKGYITGFIGPNGSGKTTTIKAMLSLIAQDKGEITIFENLINNDNSYLQDVGVVMDEAFLVKDWKIDDVREALSTFYKNWDDTSFNSYLQRFRIPLTNKVSELSRGMTVKLMLAIALSHKAKLLVLDEPTSGLDPSSREEVCEILQEYMKDEENSVFFSTHITSDLESIADFIIFIINGKIKYAGTKDDILDQYVLIKGGLDDLEIIDSSTLIGTKKNSLSFEAIIDKEDINNVVDLIIEPVSLEQLIIFFNRGENYEHY